MRCGSWACEVLACLPSTLRERGRDGVLHGFQAPHTREDALHIVASINLSEQDFVRQGRRQSVAVQSVENREFVFVESGISDWFLRLQLIPSRNVGQVDSHHTSTESRHHCILRSH